MLVHLPASPTRVLWMLVHLSELPGQGHREASAAPRSPTNPRGRETTARVNPHPTHGNRGRDFLCPAGLHARNCQTSARE